jgi:hypothetical protein
MVSSRNEKIIPAVFCSTAESGVFPDAALPREPRQRIREQQPR